MESFEAFEENIVGYKNRVEYKKNLKDLKKMVECVV